MCLAKFGSIFFTSACSRIICGPRNAAFLDPIFLTSIQTRIIYREVEKLQNFRPLLTQLIHPDQEDAISTPCVPNLIPQWYCIAQDCL